MSYQCEVKEQTTQLTLSVRTRSAVQNLPQTLGQAYKALWEYLRELGETAVGPPFVAYYNMDMQDLDIEVAVPVSKKLPAKNEIKPSEMAGGTFATCLYVGPYPAIEPAYTALMQWVEANGYKFAGNRSYEVYLNDPANTPPAELQTQILFPLQK